MNLGFIPKPSNNYSEEFVSSLGISARVAMGAVRDQALEIAEMLESIDIQFTDIAAKNYLIASGSSPHVPASSIKQVLEHQRDEMRAVYSNKIGQLVFALTKFIMTEHANYWDSINDDPQPFLGIDDMVLKTLFDGCVSDNPSIALGTASVLCSDNFEMLKSECSRQPCGQTRRDRIDCAYAKLNGMRCGKLLQGLLVRLDYLSTKSPAGRNFVLGVCKMFIVDNIRKTRGDIVNYLGTAEASSSWIAETSVERILLTIAKSKEWNIGFPRALQDTPKLYMCYKGVMAIELIMIADKFFELTDGDDDSVEPPLAY